MRNFQQKRGEKGSILQSRPVLIVLGALVLFFAWGVVGFLAKMQITVENRKIAENKVAELQKEKDSLSANIEKLKTNSGIEETIREKFGLAKEGEGEIVVVEEKPPLPAEPDKSSGFFGFFKNLFK